MPPDINRENEALFRMAALDAMLNDLRYGFRARGTLHYRWSPDE
jgi:hypothetical protein